MSNTEGLGGVRDDIISILALAFGGNKTKAATKVDDLEKLIRTEAEKGAKQAIPEIQTEVRSTVKPYIIVALALGGVALLTSISALVLTLRKNR